VLLELRRGSQSADSGLIVARTIGALNAGEALTEQFVVPLDGEPLGQFYARVDPAGTVVDCDRTNGFASAGVFRARVTDSGGLFAEDRFFAFATQLMSAPRISAMQPVSIVEGMQLTYQVRLQETPPGSRYIFEIESGQAGAEIHPQTGLFRWTPPRGSTGRFTFVLRAFNLRYDANRQNLIVDVTPTPNRDPVVTSTPVVAAIRDAVYSYDAEAIDPDGDALTYSLPVAPQGMVIDAGSGVISWTPTQAQSGPQAVTLRVSDGRGGSATQSFTVTVGAGANSPPSITSTPTSVGKAARLFVYSATANDPDGDMLTWSLTTAPAGMMIDSVTGRVQWTPTATQVGASPVVLRVSDGRAYQEQSWSIAVVAAGVPLATTVTVTPSAVAPGGSITVVVNTTGAGGPTTTSATLTPPGTPIALDADGETVLIAPATFGCRTLAVSVTDGFETASRSAQFCVADPNDTTAPEVRLLAPTDDFEVTAPSAVRGTATDANLASWILGLRPSNSPQAQPTILAQGASAFTNQAIGTLDPTLLMNGLYTLVLQATDASGNTASDSIVVRVTGDMKVGHFSLTFEDASIPVAGIPVRVTRTYDTRQRNEPLDFGFGWSVDYQNVRVRESRKLGFSWRLNRRQVGLFPEWCVVPNGQPTVTVTLPDGQVESFRAKVVPECSQITPEINVQLQFDPVDGTDSQLEQTSFGLVRLVEIAGSGVANIVDPGAPATPIDPESYRLTMPEGRVYELDQGFGIRRVTDLNGQSLTYSANGVRHSTGIGIDFTRDAQGRITRMTLPDGTAMNYAYTPDGDLATFSDPLSQVTRFTYGIARFPHYLSEITDARGVRAIRNEYDDDGRLVRTIDAGGNVIDYIRDIAGRREQVRDRRGNLTTYVYDDNGWVLSQTNALGETVLRTYDADGNTLTETNPLGQTIARTFDARGNMLTERNPLGEVVTSTYDARNSLLIQVDALGRRTISNAWDARSGNLTSTTNALDEVTRFGYDAGIGSGGSGELNRMTDALGQVARYIIDSELDATNGRGWRVAEIDAMGTRTDYTHDANGRVLSVTTRRSIPAAGGGSTTEILTTRNTYDAKGNLTRVEHPDGSITTTEFNAIDKPIRECDPRNRCTRMAYDDRGNLTRTTYPDGTFEESAYDANGNTVSQRDRGGRVTRMAYDAADRLVETIHPDDTPGTDADNPRTRSEYDRAGRMMSPTGSKEPLMIAVMEPVGGC